MPNYFTDKYGYAEEEEEEEELVQDPDASIINEQGGAMDTPLPDTGPLPGNYFVDKYGFDDPEPIPEELPEEDVDPTWQDYGRMVMSGGAAIGSGVGWLLQKMGAEDIGTAIKERSDESRRMWLDSKLDVIGLEQEGLSDQARVALETEFLGEGAAGDKWDKAKLTAAASLLGTMAGMGLGGVLTKGLTTAGARTGVISVAGPGQALTGGQKVAAAIGYGAGEAGVAAPSAGAATETEVMGMKHEKLMQSLEYQAAYEGLSGLDEAERQEKAKALVADAAAGKAASLTLLSTFILSAPFSATIARLASGVPSPKGRIAGTVTGGAGEATQEFLQSGAEQLAQNIAIQQEADPTQRLGEDVLEEAVGGAAAGGILGAPAGFATSGGVEETPGPVADLERQQQAARDNAAAQGGDALDQELAAATAGAEGGAVIDEQVARRERLFKVYKAIGEEAAYAETQVQEDEARERIQMEAAERYEAGLKQIEEEKKAAEEQAQLAEKVEAGGARVKKEKFQEAKAARKEEKAATEKEERAAKADEQLAGLRKRRQELGLEPPEEGPPKPPPAAGLVLKPAEKAVLEKGKVPETVMAQALRKAAEKVEAAPDTETTTTPEKTELPKGMQPSVKFQGLGIQIENPVGSTREGVSAEGVKWSQDMKDHYGFFKNTESAEGTEEELDVFVGEDLESEQIFVVDQVNKEGVFDEHKVMVGYPNAVAARRAYLRNYPKGFKAGPISTMEVPEFKEWLKSGDQTVPVQPGKVTGAAPALAEQLEEEVIRKKTRKGGRRSRILYRKGEEEIVEKIREVAPDDVMEELEFLSEGYEEGENIKLALEDAIDVAEGNNNRKFLNRLRKVGVAIGMFRVITEEELSRITTLGGKAWDFVQGGKKYVFNAEGYKTVDQEYAAAEEVEAAPAPTEAPAAFESKRMAVEDLRDVPGDPQRKGPEEMAEFTKKIQSGEIKPLIIVETVNGKPVRIKEGNHTLRVLDALGRKTVTVRTQDVGAEIGGGIVAYHGGKTKLSGIRGDRLFFTPSRADASNYGDVVSAARLNMRNPKTIDYKGDEDNKGPSGNGVEYDIDEARKAGHDGVIFLNIDSGFEGEESLTQYVVFSREQITPIEAEEGRDFKAFFSAVTQGVTGTSSTGAPYTPVISAVADKMARPGNPVEQFSTEYAKHRGNFDDHIAFSIPGFKEIQQTVGAAIAANYGKGDSLLDIGASEGSFVKSITALSGMRTVALDPNPDMQESFNSVSTVKGSEYSLTALGPAEEEGMLAWVEDGVDIEYFDPQGERFDVVHEAMVFQFISNDRKNQIARTRELLKEDGVLIVEEKVHTENQAANEKKKNTYKGQFFEKKDLDAKSAEVLEGMHENMVHQNELESVLSDNFDHVTQFWDSGNFKGYMASNSREALNKMTISTGDTTSEYATEPTPRAVSGPVGETVEATHYSTQEGLDVLEGGRYGTGIRGREARRLAAEGAEGIRERVYLYAGPHKKEPGLGEKRYQWTQPNMYDLDKDPMGFRSTVREKYAQMGEPGNKEAIANELDNLILLAGYAGVFSPSMNNTGYVFGDVALGGALGMLYRREEAAALQTFLEGSQVKHAVYHSSVADFDVFDFPSHTLGAHFGTQKAAFERFRNLRFGWSPIDIQDDENGFYLYNIELEIPVEPDLDGDPTYYDTDADAYEARNNIVEENAARPAGRADEAAGVVPAEEESLRRPNTLALYISLKNPLRITKDTGFTYAAPFINYLPKNLQDKIPDSFKAGAIGKQFVRTGLEMEKVREWLMDLGYDGVVYTNEIEDKGSESYIVFKPEQVKSAVGNRGTFDPGDPNILYRRGDTGGLTRAQAERQLEGMITKLPLLQPTILDTPEQAPAEIYEQMRADGALGAKGVYNPVDDTLYIFAENHRDAEDLVRTIMHEGVAHKGLRYLLGDRFTDVMRSVFENGDAAAIARTARKYGLDLTDSADQLIAAEEYIASLAESGIESNVLQRVVSAVRQALRDLGLITSWTDSDIIALLRDARRGLRGRKLSAVKITTEAEIEETGELVDIEEPADVVLRQHQKRTGVVSKLMECIST